MKITIEYEGEAVSFELPLHLCEPEQLDLYCEKNYRKTFMEKLRDELQEASQELRHNYLERFWLTIAPNLAHEMAEDIPYRPGMK